jgi:hypothetical protein
VPSIVIVFKQIQYHGIVDFCRRIPSCYQRGWITELSISSQAPHPTFELSSGFISLVYCWGLLRRFYLLRCGQCNFWSSLHLDLLWRDIILLEPNAVLENFITNLPANREFGALKNFREQQGLNFLIVHDITSSCNELFSNNNNLCSFTMQHFISRRCGHDHHGLLVYQ